MGIIPGWGDAALPQWQL